GRGFFLYGADHLSDFFGSGCGAFRQFAHFVGNHRKPAPLLSGTRGFDGGIEGQQIRLVGDVINHADDATDLIGTFPSSSTFRAVLRTDSEMARIFVRVSSTIAPPCRAVSAACFEDAAARLEFSETCMTVVAISCMAVTT